MREEARKQVLVAAAWLLCSWACAIACGGPAAPLHVRIDRSANVYVNGVPVDTLVVHRRQWVYWQKYNAADPDLSVRFGRRLVHPRHPVQIRVSHRGKPAAIKVNAGARLTTYVATPERGFASDLPQDRLIYMRVVPPPSP